MPAHKKPDELTLATDAFTKAVSALIPPDRSEAVAEFSAALSDLLAVVIGRATALAAGAVVQVHERTERRLDSQSDRFHDLSRSVDARLDSIMRDMTALAEHVPPIDTLYKIAIEQERTSARLAALERQVGGHASDTT